MIILLIGCQVDDKVGARNANGMVRIGNCDVYTRISSWTGVRSHLQVAVDRNNMQ